MVSSLVTELEEPSLVSATPEMPCNASNSRQQTADWVDSEDAQPELRPLSLTWRTLKHLIGLGTKSFHEVLGPACNWSVDWYAVWT